MKRTKIVPVLSAFIKNTQADDSYQARELAAMEKELRALLAVVRAAEEMCHYSIPPRDFHTPGEDARRATFRALARLTKVSAP